MASCIFGALSTECNLIKIDGAEIELIFLSYQTNGEKKFPSYDQNIPHSKPGLSVWAVELRTDDRQTELQIPLSWTRTYPQKLQ